MDTPETRYAVREDGVSIAYQVVGNGPRDLIYVPGFISHLDLQWADPGFSRFIRRLGGFARVILFDKPGTGISDPIAHVPTLEERIADVATVLDAAGSERAVVMGFSEGASAAVMFAATWPGQAEALILYGGIYAAQPSPEQLAEMDFPAEEVGRRWQRLDGMLDAWGSGGSIEMICPSHGSAMDRRAWGVFERASASPRMARALVDAVKRIDVSAVATTISVPTLLLHRTGDFAPVQSSRWLAPRMPDAGFVELPGVDHAFWTGDPDPVVDEIEQFLTGARRSAEPDRALATVLFTDLVESTRRAAELGDAGWRKRLEAHEAVIHRETTVFRGRLVKSMGDGHLCVFDGPARALRCALAIRDAAPEPVRCGVHTGECEVMGDDVGGLAVHIGARIGALAAAGEVLASNTVKDLVVGSPLAFADRGEHELRGVPGTWRLHAVGALEKPPPAISSERDLRPGDRMALRIARRTPQTMRGAARLTRRLSR